MANVLSMQSTSKLVVGSSLVLPQAVENQVGSATVLQFRARSPAALHGKAAILGDSEELGVDVGIILSKRL